jgi:hypothetical protein
VSSAESEGTTACVSSRASSRCFQFVDPTSGSPSIDGFLLGSGELHLLRRASTIIAPRVFSFFHFPVCAGGPLPSLPGHGLPARSPLHTHAQLALPSGRHGPLRRPPTPCAQPSPVCPLPSPFLAMVREGGGRRRWKFCEKTRGEFKMCTQI